MAAAVRRTHVSRPLGISILAILLFLSGILDLAVVILSLFSVRTGRVRFSTPQMTQNGVATQTATIVTVALLLALAILPILLARGLWNLKHWAYWSMVLLELITIAVGVASLMNHQSLEQTLVSLALPIIILLYLLLDHNVHAAFHR